jgi:hypothetical protein
MLRTSLTRYLWWAAARLGLCLAGIDEAELKRFLLQRFRWIVVAVGGAGSFFVLGGGIAGGRSRKGAGATASYLYYIAAAVLALAALVVWWYSREMVRRAVKDRSGPAVACKGTVRRLIAARQGGWPLLLRSSDGRWFWLTGSSKALAPMRARLTKGTVDRPFQLTLTLTYYPRSRVIGEISGMAVEVLDRALISSWESGGVVYEGPVTSPLTTDGQRSAACMNSASLLI